MTPIALDVVNQTLVKGTEQIQLPPKVFGMLKYLSQHPQQLVTKEELLEKRHKDDTSAVAVFKFKKAKTTFNYSRTE